MNLKKKKLEIFKKPKNNPKKKFPRWLTLSLYNNCFNDGNRTHLGICFRGVYYCITHASGNGIMIAKNMLKMAEISDRDEYLKKTTSIPTVLYKTKMKINEVFLVQAVLSNELNKM